MTNKKFSKKLVKSSKAKVRKVKNWSKHQENIYKHVRDGEGHAMVLASPGSGKTTTIEESLYHVPKHEKTLCLAFNKSAADSLADRVPDGVDAKTFHKLGFQTVKDNWGHIFNLSARSCVDLKNDGAMMLAGQEVGLTEKSLSLRESLVEAMKMSKTMLAESVEDIDVICSDFGISACGISNTDFSKHVKSMMDKTRDKPILLNGENVISFDDMLWLPHVHGWAPQKYDRVFVDEAQDLSNARISLMMKAMSPGSRVCAVGDRNQAVYGFAGATIGIVDTIIDDMNAKSLPLSVSYRCPKSVVELAAQINPDIEAAPNAIDGEIRAMDYDAVSTNIKPGSVILSRTNYPLISMAFELLKKGLSANVLGKDVGDRFLWRIKMWAPTTVQELRREILAWRQEGVEKQLERKRDASRITDEADSILLFTEGAANLSQVTERIRKCFHPKNESQILLSTAHKAKGGEWDNVYLLENTFKPGKSQEEDNIFYVGLTRAKQSLTFVRQA